METRVHASCTSHTHTHTHAQLGTQTNTHTHTHTHTHTDVVPCVTYTYMYMYINLIPCTCTYTQPNHEVFQQCLQAVLLLFSINFPIFQYFASFFSILPDAPYTVLQYVQSLPNFSVFSEFCQYFCSEFSKKILVNPYTWRLCSRKTIN